MGFGFAIRKIAGFVTKKTNLAKRFGGETLPKNLKLIGNSKNGTKVYRGTDDFGKQYTLSTKKDGSPLKLITKKNVEQNTRDMASIERHTTVKNYDRNEGIYLYNSETKLKSEYTDWLGRLFKSNDRVKIAGKNKYNNTRMDYSDRTDSMTTYTQIGNPNWKRTVHSRPGIEKCVTYNKFNDNFQNVQTYFELNNFKFPGSGAVHNGRIGYTKGISPLDGEYLRKTRVNPFGDYLNINYNT